MYGDIANKLIQDAKLTQMLETLPLYQEELVRSIVREVRDLHRDTEAVLARYGGELPTQDRKVACWIFVQHLCMRRNKRCLLAYQRLRSTRLDAMAWNDVDTMDQEVLNNLNPNEQDYLRDYSELLVDYKGEWVDVDLTGSLEPPRDLFIDVRVLKDAGEIQTEYG
ncbi:Psf1p [Sugiyamaella lignohabitans]|uniref:DNA replication complex GINS protein PSF1 n=1 Tax=Sugiyamaella lignohabitans TaxID=796027 RepID=A0A167E839_9ASCO|nr:Psf1p [Sugiyamaella lignohabitans]ANB13756.1 Psf1p [Sugiyamaella lignohabitans]